MSSAAPASTAAVAVASWPSCWLTSRPTPATASGSSRPHRGGRSEAAAEGLARHISQQPRARNTTDSSNSAVRHDAYRVATDAAHGPGAPAQGR